MTTSVTVSSGLLAVLLLALAGCKAVSTRAALADSKSAAEEACRTARYNRDYALAALEDLDLAWEAAKEAVDAAENRRGERPSLAPRARLYDDAAEALELATSRLEEGRRVAEGASALEVQACTGG